MEVESESRNHTAKRIPAVREVDLSTGIMLI
jgi:hypothetical protein